MIANRGEIAVRIMRTCRSMGIETVAVYSDADADALHVRVADRSVHLGGAAPNESYLSVDRIIDAALGSGAEAIHPGYGFLAESEQLARACVESGIVFVGPSADAIAALGNKSSARSCAESCGVPVITGATLAGNGAGTEDPETLAAKIGYPLLIKAAAGGGGKGMRLVSNSCELRDAIDAAGREALNAFGSAELILERFLERSRHVEVQILGDLHGNIVHLFERECSIQRRHQKILEEAPAPALERRLRDEICDAALRLATAGGYTNAGTVEFLIDEEGGFFFLEVNTRLQVEHPVTEAVTGLDLVAAQLRVAAGEKLRWEQEAITCRGHAIECRVYAEDPAAAFMPSPGTILHQEEPVGPGIRVDSGAVSGSEIPIDYDPIVAKLIAWGEDRDSARGRMARALSEYPILGIATTIPFLHDLIAARAFAEAHLSTRFIDEHMASWTPRRDALAEALVAFVADAREPVAAAPRNRCADEQSHPSPWAGLGRWRL